MRPHDAKTLAMRCRDAGHSALLQKGQSPFLKRPTPWTTFLSTLPLLLRALSSLLKKPPCLLKSIDAPRWLPQGLSHSRRDEPLFKPLCELSGPLSSDIAILSLQFRGFPNGGFLWGGQISIIGVGARTGVAIINFASNPCENLRVYLGFNKNLPHKNRKINYCNPGVRTHPNYWDLSPSQKPPFGNLQAIPHITRYFLREFSRSPKWCDTPPWYLVSHRHICAIAHLLHIAR